MLYLKAKNRIPRHALILPIISSVVIPIAILDLWIEFYHRTCFPLYKMPYVKRGNYIKIMDRFNLPYLNAFEKVYCAYCGYANGVMHYWTEIAAKTESYWCGIQHEKTPQFISPKHHDSFVEYGEEKEFKQKYLCK